MHVSYIVLMKTLKTDSEIKRHYIPKMEKKLFYSFLVIYASVFNNTHLRRNSAVLRI